jgi:hypothetical protein
MPMLGDAKLLHSFALVIAKGTTAHADETASWTACTSVLK